MASCQAVFSLFFQAPGRRMSITFKFRKKGVFLRCEIRAIYEIIGGDIPRKQYYLAKQLPSLSLINCHNWLTKELAAHEWSTKKNADQKKVFMIDKKRGEFFKCFTCHGAPLRHNSWHFVYWAVSSLRTFVASPYKLVGRWIAALPSRPVHNTVQFPVY